MGKRQAIHQSEQRRLKVIKTASNKQLVEKFMFHVPQSVMGTSFPPSVIKATQSEIETLRTQLAKANERVKELEAHNALLMQVAWEMKEGKPDAFYKIKDARSAEPSDVLNKFAIEKKIEALDEFMPEFSLVNDYYNVDKMALLSDLELRIEQLRKEQE